MERRNFIKQCGAMGLACLGLPMVLDSCTGVHHITGIVNDNKIKVEKSEFATIKNGKPSFKKYIIVRAENSIFPMVVYRFSDTDYKTLLLRCTHQSYELNVNGDLISCSAHGSEFTNRGEVVQGPAEQSLQSFSTSSDEKNIYINVI